LNQLRTIALVAANGISPCIIQMHSVREEDLQQYWSEIMKVRVVALIAGMVAAAGFSALRSKHKTKISRTSTTTLDLNTASMDSLSALGLNSEAADRIVENRPYRRKLELLERFVLDKADYDLIKQRISTDRSHANDAVRVAS
jgi:hypothetical protein